MDTGDALERPLTAELMDRVDLALADAERALADLDRVNKALFGYHSSCRTLLPRIFSGPSRQTLIDLGTGSGRITCRLKQRSLRRGIQVRVVGVDRKLCHLLYGRRCGTGQLRVVAEAEALPFRSHAVDWSFSNLLFHHFAPAANRRVLQEMRRVARRGTVVVDLRRTFWARAIIRLLLPLLRVGPVASHDGKLSADQAWCLKGVARLTEHLPVIELRRRFPFRFSLVLQCEGQS